MQWMKILAMISVLAVISATPLWADVTENFDEFTNIAYGAWDYNGFHMVNALCTNVGATAGCVNPLPSNAVRLRDSASPDINNQPYLEYVGTDGNGKDGGVGTITIYFKSWDGNPTSVYALDYSQNGGPYVALDTLVSFQCASYETYTLNANITGDNIKVRIQRVLGERMHIDLFSLTDYGADLTPPAVMSVTMINAGALDVLFDQVVDPTTSENENNYVVITGGYYPATAARDGTNLALVHLTFVPDLAPNDYFLIVNAVEDLNGNACSFDSTAFTITVLQPGQVVITEVMYDDTAGADSEWVEIHNTTAGDIDISGWYLTDDDTYPTLSSEGALLIPNGTILPAGGYLTLALADLGELTGEIICTLLGTFGLNNAGDNLALYSASTAGVLIDGSLSVAYPDLATAGNSIEKCDESVMWSGDVTAWHQSLNVYGVGRYQHCTPGAANSICVPDIEGPTLVSAASISNMVVDITFNEPVDQVTGETTANYAVDLGVGNPTTAFRQSDNTKVRLTFGSPMAANTYTVTVNNVQDLYGNAILPGSQIQFTIFAAPPDIIFTEIMPNPNFSGLADSLGEWFEIYNPNATAIDLTGWIVADNAGQDTIESGSIASHDYFVFCSNGDTLTNGGVPADYAYHFGTQGWGISLSNTGDSIAIRDQNGQLAKALRFTSIFPYGAGYSAQLKDLTYNPAIDTSWCRADSIFPGARNGDRGTPGAATICGSSAPSEVSICEIREQDACGVPVLLNSLVTTRGVVTYEDSCRRNAYIELNGCAVMIYGNSVRYIMQNSTRRMRVGDIVDVNGHIRQFNGLTEIDSLSGIPVTITFVSENNMVPPAVTVPASEVDIHVDNCATEAYESRHVHVQNVYFVDGNGTNTFAASTNYNLTNDVDTIQFRVNACDTLVGALIPQGIISLTGTLGQFKRTSCYCDSFQFTTGRLAPFSEPSCAGPIQATVYRLAGAEVDSVEVRWQNGVGEQCPCFRIYTTDNPSNVYPNGYTLAGCVCNRNWFRDLMPAATPKRYYVVTADSACP